MDYIVGRPAPPTLFRIACFTLAFGVATTGFAQDFGPDGSDGELPETEGTRSERIVQGETTTGWPAVVALMGYGEPFCTGTLIAPRVVLTAAHCLEDGDPDSVYFGNTPFDGDGTEVTVSQGLMHPDYEDADEDSYFDIGLVFLDEDGPTAPLPVRGADIQPLVGAQVLYVGFGETQGTGGDGLKKQATARITDLFADVMEVEPESGSACYGDSGGPVLHDSDLGWEVVGITSFGYTDDCMDPGGNTRTDVYYDWIELQADGLVSAGDDDDDNDDDDDADDDDDGPGRVRGNGCQASVGAAHASDGLAFVSLLLAACALRRRSR